jgi:hypothetical protein
MDLDFSPTESQSVSAPPGVIGLRAKTGVPRRRVDLLSSVVIGGAVFAQSVFAVASYRRGED